MTTEILLSTHNSASGWRAGGEEILERGGDARLFIRVADPEIAPRATVVLTHGLGEHSNRYGHVAAEMVARGWRVVAWDLPGHGRSSGRRGDTRDYQEFVDDLGAVAARYRAAGKPLFFYAHSLGAQITLRYLETAATLDGQGAIIASPWLRLAFDPPRWKLALARMAMRIWPRFTQATGNRWERLSRDHAHLTSFPDLDLVHHGISARMFFSVRAEGEKALTEAGRVRMPLLLLHGDADPITCQHATREFFERAGGDDKTLRIFAGARHEVHNDLERVQVIREIGDWVEARVK